MPIRGQEKYPGMQIKLLNVYDDSSPRQEAAKNKVPGQRWSFDDEPSLPHILIESVEFQSPVDPTWPPDHHRTILFESPLRDSAPAAFAKEVLGELDRLNNVAADKDVYPDFDPSVKADMRAETQMFFRELVNEDLSAMNLIRSDFSVLNERMARHYGIANVWGREFRRVPISTGSHRGGVLTHASVLMANSTGTKSHPVLRAVWVRDRLLNDPPGSPPADVPKLDQIDPKFAELPIRKQMEIHRDSDSCRKCHRGLDPWGLALENFDAVGLWHEDIDSNAELPGGVQLHGINDLQDHLLHSHGDHFARSLVVRLTSYALGRQLDINDRPMIEELMAAFTKNDYRIKGLVREIVQTPEFQNY